MRSNQEIAMQRYAAAARAHYDTHPEDEAALHHQHLDSLGLEHDVKQHIIDNRLPEVAAHLAKHPEEARHMDAVKALRAKVAGGKTGETASDNEKTDKYISERRRK